MNIEVSYLSFVGIDIRCAKHFLSWVQKSLSNFCNQVCQKVKSQIWSNVLFFFKIWFRFKIAYCLFEISATQRLRWQVIRVHTSNFTRKLKWISFLQNFRIFMKSCWSRIEQYLNYFPFRNFPSNHQLALQTRQQNLSQKNIDRTTQWLIHSLSPFL